MTQKQIKEIQERVGFVGDDIDGFYGTFTQKQVRKYLRSLMPVEHPWPKADRKSIEAFYGPPGTGNLVNIDVAGMGIAYLGTPVTTVRVHKLVAESLLVCLDYVATHYPEIALQYGGVYNYRDQRNGSALSKHAWGIAIDLDPKRNGYKTQWPLKAQMPFSIMEAFAMHGWLSGGAFWGFDAMHFQATQ